MKDYQVEGFNLWDENYKLYDDLKVEGETDEPNVSSRYNKYLRPYQIQRNNKAYLGYTFHESSLPGTYRLRRDPSEYPLKREVI